MTVLGRVVAAGMTALALGLGSGLAATAHADVRGVVIDANSGTPIARAIVTVDRAVLRTDEHGGFDAPGSHAAVAVRAAGYLRASAPAIGGDPLRIALVPFRPRAVYLSAFGITSPVLRDAAVKLKATRSINALVIDTKGDRGITPYPSAARAPLAKIAGAVPASPKLPHFDALVADLHRQGFYLIARIVVFKDDPLVAAHPEWAVRDASGGIWRDREGLRWIDPFKRDAWLHNLDVAEEAARLGFDEIQFDYVRFPDASGVRFSEPSTREGRTSAIVGFLHAARARLAPYNVFVAADIFGYVCWNLNDTSIGQQIELLGDPLDYISPMLYPSGFTWGLPGCTRPTSDPGQIVRRSLTEAIARTRLDPVRFRPWLQAFRDYAFDHHAFGAAEIRAQTDAADAVGTDGWMLWNAQNRYDPDDLPH